LVGGDIPHREGFVGGQARGDTIFGATSRHNRYCSEVLAAGRPVRAPVQTGCGSRCSCRCSTRPCRYGC
jgi:hypothetical protein